MKNYSFYALTYTCFIQFLNLLAGLGYGMMLLSSFIIVYNHMVLVYALYHLVVTVTSVLPWTCAPKSGKYRLSTSKCG